MASETEKSLRLEIGHVLFIDLVGYSRLLIDEQKERLRQLTDIVLATTQVQEATNEQLVRLPTGDGMALVFRNSSEEPARCALEIAQALKAHPEIAVRMGIHSGPVSEVTDVSGRVNVAGVGINMAQRVMDCGDAGHILLSQRVAEDLAEYRQWSPHLHPLGECEVKHGVRLQVVNLCTEQVGNPALPEKFSRAKQEQDALALAAAEVEKGSRRAVVVRRRKITALVISLLAITFIALGALLLTRPKGGTTAIQSLAVKPLSNLSGDPSKNYFADGMTDELTTKLAQISALKRVISPSTMMQYKQSSKSNAQIARELHVAAVVEGSVVLAGDEARIAVQLIDVASDKTLWAESYTRNVANIVRLQDEVAVAIANAIALKLTPGEKARFAAGRAVNPEAYDYFLRGKNVAHLSREACEVSIGLLQKAISIDNSFAEAYAELAGAYFDESYFYDPNKELAKKAEDSVAKALQLDPTLPTAILAHAALLWTPEHEFPHEQAIAEARRALTVAPNFGDAHFFLGAAYFHVGLIEEAIAEFKRAEEIAPGEGPRFHLGLMAMYQGHSAEAAGMMEKNPNGMVPAFVQCNIVFALFNEGQTRAAQDRIDKARKQFPDAGGLMAATEAFLLAAAGDKVHAHEKIDEALKAGQGFGDFHHTTYAIASACALMHEDDEALKWLNYTAENGFPNLTWFARDPALASLQKTPRFIALLDDMRPRFEKLKSVADAPLTFAGN